MSINLPSIESSLLPACVFAVVLSPEGWVIVFVDTLFIWVSDIFVVVVVVVLVVVAAEMATELVLGLTLEEMALDDVLPVWVELLANEVTAVTDDE